MTHKFKVGDIVVSETGYKALITDVVRIYYYLALTEPCNSFPKGHAWRETIAVIDNTCELVGVQKLKKIRRPFFKRKTA